MKAKITLALLCLINTYAFAQEESQKKESFKLPVIGIGIKSLNLLSEMSQNTEMMPGNRIILPINISQSFRLQPEFGIASQSTFSEEISDDLASKSNIFGLGAYGMFQKDRTNYYAGLKYLSAKSSIENLDYSSNPNPPFNTIFSKATDKYTYSIWGLVIGGEYFFGKHFSVGAEVGFQSVNSTTKDPQEEEVESDSFNKESNLVVRLYF